MALASSRQEGGLLAGVVWVRDAVGDEREEGAWEPRQGVATLFQEEMRRHWGWWAGNWHDSCSKANTQRATWRVTQSTQGGSWDQSGGPGKKDLGEQQWDTYQVPGPAWGMAWDIETERQGPWRQGGTCLCVCVCVCVKCGIRVLCVFGCVVCACVL